MKTGMKAIVVILTQMNKIMELIRIVTWIQTQTRLPRIVKVMQDVDTEENDPNKVIDVEIDEYNFKRVK